MDMVEKREELIAGLRELADFFEQTPEMPMPSYIGSILYFENNREKFVEWARLLGRVEKATDPIYFMLRRDFGPLRIELNINRDEARDAETIPAHTEDDMLLRDLTLADLYTCTHRVVYKWHCQESILKNAAAKKQV